MKFFLLALFVATAAAAPLENNQAVELIVNGVPEGEALELGNIVDIKLKEHVNGNVAASSDLLHPLTAAGIAETAAVAAAAAAAVAPTPIQIVDQAENTVEPIAVAPVVPVNPIVPVELPSPIVMPDPVSPILVPAVPDLNPVAVEDLSPVIFPAEQAALPEPVVLPAPVVPVVIPEPSPVEITPVAPAPVAPVFVDEALAPVAPIFIDEASAPAPTPVAAAQGPNEIFNDGIVQVQVNQDAGVMSTIQSWFNMVVNYFNNGVPTSHQIV